MDGYWLALPTLALVAGLRFLRSRVAAVVLAILCFAFSAVERVGWVGIVALGFSEHTTNTISIARAKRSLIPVDCAGCLASSFGPRSLVGRPCLPYTGKDH